MLRVFGASYRRLDYISRVGFEGRGPGGVTSGWGEGGRREQGANQAGAGCESVCVPVLTNDSSGKTAVLGRIIKDQVLIEGRQSTSTSGH